MLSSFFIISSFVFEIKVRFAYTECPFHLYIKNLCFLKFLFPTSCNYPSFHYSNKSKKFENFMLLGKYLFYRIFVPRNRNSLLFCTFRTLWTLWFMNYSNYHKLPERYRVKYHRVFKTWITGNYHFNNFLIF